MGVPIMLRWVVLIMTVWFIAACDEPPPQWRDDALPVDNGEKNDKDISDIKDEDQPDQSDDTDTAVTDDAGYPDDEEDSDDEEESDDEPVNCTLASPTAAEKTALQKLFSEDDTVFCTAKTPGGVSYFVAVREEETIGYAFPGSNYGFDGQIVALTGMTVEAKSIAVAIVSQRESWWYMIGQWFFDQFKEIDITQITIDPKYSDNCWPCTEMYDAFKPYTVDAVSGATYTSNAVTKDVWDAIYLYDEVFSPPAK